MKASSFDIKKVHTINLLVTDEAGRIRLLSAEVPVGEFTFKAGKSDNVDLTNRGTDGRIVIDAVRWVWLGVSIRLPRLALMLNGCHCSTHKRMKLGPT